MFQQLQYNQQFKKFEPLEYTYDVCEAILLWEQVDFYGLYFHLCLSCVLGRICTEYYVVLLQYRNMTTVLTREYLDVRPGGWVDYAPLRIAQLYESQKLTSVCVSIVFSVNI